MNRGGSQSLREEDTSALTPSFAEATAGRPALSRENVFGNRKRDRLEACPTLRANGTAATTGFSSLVEHTVHENDCENALGRGNYARAGALATPGEGTRPTGTRFFHSRW